MGIKFLAFLLGRQAAVPIARPRKNAARSMGGRYVRYRGYEAFAPLKAQKPPSPGMPKGSQPLGAVSFRGFLCRSKEIRIKSFYKRFR